MANGMGAQDLANLSDEELDSILAEQESAKKQQAQETAPAQKMMEAPQKVMQGMSPNLFEGIPDEEVDSFLQAQEALKQGTITTEDFRNFVADNAPAIFSTLGATAGGMLGGGIPGGMAGGAAGGALGEEYRQQYAGEQRDLGAIGKEALLGGAFEAAPAIGRGVMGAAKSFLPARKFGAEAIEQAGKRVGAEIPEGMLTSPRDPLAQQLSETQERQMLSQLGDASRAKLAINAPEDVSKGFIGKAGASGLTQKLKARLGIAGQQFDEIAETVGGKQLTPDGLNSLQSSIDDLVAASEDPIVQNALVQQKDRLGKLKTINGLKEMRTRLRREAQASVRTDPTRAQALNDVAALLGSTREDEVLEAIMREQGPDQAKKFMDDLVKTDAVFAQLARDIDDIATPLGINTRGKTQNQVLREVLLKAKKNPKALGSKLLSFDNPLLMKAVQKESPESFEMVRKAWLSRAAGGQELTNQNIKQFVKKLDHPDIPLASKKLLVGDDGVQFFKDVSDLLGAMPPKTFPQTFELSNFIRAMVVFGKQQGGKIRAAAERVDQNIGAIPLAGKLFEPISTGQSTFLPGPLRGRSVFETGVSGATQAYGREEKSKPLKKTGKPAPAIEGFSQERLAPLPNDPSLKREMLRNLLRNPNLSPKEKAKRFEVINKHDMMVVDDPDKLGIPDLNAL